MAARQVWKEMGNVHPEHSRVVGPQRPGRVILTFSTGAIITANASSMSMFLGGRWLTGMTDVPH